MDLIESMPIIAQMEPTMKRVLILASSSLIFSAASSSFAIAERSQHKCGNTSGKWMSKGAAKIKALNRGYIVRGVKKEGRCYEVKALTSRGKRIEFLMNPVSGKIIGREKTEK